MEIAAARADRQRQLVERVYHMADAIKTIESLKYASATPSELHSQLKRVDVALTKALQVLLSLDLRHAERQDLASEPFNWPLVKALQQRKIATEIMRLGGHPEPDFISAAYPPELIDEMQSLRDVARSEAAFLKPKRGNSASRSARAAALSKLGKNFVFEYRLWFRRMPRISKTGWAVDVLTQVLLRAGFEDADAADVLRRAVEKDGSRKSMQRMQEMWALDDGPNASPAVHLNPRCID
jgi:hypothetical protein